MDILRIISFDVDGTLVNSNFNEWIWEKEIPRLYAEKNKKDFLQALKEVKEEYDRIGEKDLRWYDINYWLKKWNLPSTEEKIIKKYKDKIKVYPEVISTLERLKGHFSLIIITNMPLNFLKPKLEKIGNHFDFYFSTLSEFKSLKTPSAYKKIAQKLKTPTISFLHIGDHPQFDYLYPRKVGMKAYLLDRKGRRKGEEVIHSLEEIEKRLMERENFG